MAVYVERGVIAEVGDAKTLEKKYSKEKIIKSDRVLMMPSFIDSHDPDSAIGTFFTESLTEVQHLQMWD